MYKLFVHSSLKSGHLNHWMLFGCPMLGVAKINDLEGEIYYLSLIRAELINIFESICGWAVFYNSQNGVFYYQKV